MTFTSTMVDQKCIQLVTAEHANLQRAIDDLGSNIDATLGRQKEDLQRTHKTEMRSSMVKIESLSKEKTCLEESIVTNERANQLETQRDWYKREALHLDELLEQSNARQKDLVDKLDESEQDRELLKDRVEKILRHKFVLEKKLRELGIDVSALCAEATEQETSTESVEDDGQND